MKKNIENLLLFKFLEKTMERFIDWFGTIYSNGKNRIPFNGKYGKRNRANTYLMSKFYK
tara:strand:+ start:514 stop:690 length:177 start_codon:yes stop_codon:yes gene_type:complete